MPTAQSGFFEWVWYFLKTFGPIGSLCDLTSGSGDKGTPVVLVQGYFDNYTD